MQDTQEAEVKKFNVGASIMIKPIEELEARVKDTDLNSEAKNWFYLCFEQSFIDGAAVRDRYNDDSPRCGTIKQALYEQAVTDTFNQHLNLTSEQVELAYDLAKYSYHEGFRLNSPEIPNKMKKVLALLEPSEESSYTIDPWTI